MVFEWERGRGGGDILTSTQHSPFLSHLPHQDIQGSKSLSAHFWTTSPLLVGDFTSGKRSRKMGIFLPPLSRTQSTPKPPVSSRHSFKMAKFFCPSISITWAVWEDPNHKIRAVKAEVFFLYHRTEIYQL